MTVATMAESSDSGPSGGSRGGPSSGGPSGTQGACVVCKDAPKKNMLRDCNHFSICENCIASFVPSGVSGECPKCPVCRTEVKGVEVAYDP